jgi:putative (di)nucleoside polyphosphate hydrolase
VIDAQGFRANVGIILCNHDNHLLWARRIGQNAWQFPQGGIRENETPEQALYRELHEEVGLQEQHVEIVGVTHDWLHYHLPRQLIRHDRQPLCIGQKQRWFLLRLLGEDRDVCLDTCPKPEFDHWRWVDYWHPLSEVVSFKREVYENALKELEPLLFQNA